MKHTLLIFLYVLNSSLWAASWEVDLRNEVVMVHPTYREDVKTCLLMYAKELKKGRNKDAYKRMLELAKDTGWGSGFVYRHPDGRCFVVSNKHVVRQSDRATILFHRRNNLCDSIDSAAVVAVDEVLDLALIALPSDFTRVTSLPICVQRLDEGAEVFTAGFPSIGKQAVWQLGKGIVSNNELIVTNASAGDSIPLYQHTAQVDPGNSGGPLLVQHLGEYQVAGVNFAQVTNRDNAGMAISGADVKEFLARYFQRAVRGSIEEELEVRSEEFARLVNEGDFRKLIPYVSYAYATRLTLKGQNYLYRYASLGAREYCRQVQNAPVEASVVLLADSFCKRFDRKNISVHSPEALPKKEKSKKKEVVYPQTNFAFGRNQSTAVMWVNESNNWRIAHMDAILLDKSQLKK